ncbi:polyketide synthase [Pochonia chlamydosporia 170]|uniref:Polyketide synthase n=1 Tax=Pochonia chlamydosporia 170 TaxID=1380566 RepID=A0A179EXD6_METCM|nr:polyketide synthase [Pochonia chlamydosporia 170]OAQ57609.1 polyketide synthase [Pochonia chlamydosporia 170]
MGSVPTYDTTPSQGSDTDHVMPIAIIGMAGRFPGDAENPMKLWDMIAEGRSALCDIPENRFNINAYYHPNNERQGTINVRKAHFMKRDVAAFDAPFFTMPIAEAQAMDPQQRMALECTYEALENAGIRMDNVNGSNTSCYVGCFTRDYSDMMACDPEDLPLYHGTGTGSAIMSNRISWFFNMKGPSVSLDTACSSSMVALHLGCQSLRTGETTMSIVGGTNLMLMPDIMGAMTRLHFLSPDGKCQSFDHKANGYSRGAGFCVLKPLHLALKDGDVIRGVIRNSGVGQDGNTPGITLPSGEAQESLIRRVYAEAGLSMAHTSYAEAHGTGTPAGDPVEAGALSRTLGAARAPGDPLYIGSVKTNVGHLEGGSGLVQVVKAVMMLEKGDIPPSIWFEKPNPRIPLQEWNLTVPTQLTPWPVQGLRRVSINSFGYGGTNAHCIIDDAYHYLRARKLRGNHNVQNLGNSSLDSTPDSAIGMSPNLPDSMVSWSSVTPYLPVDGDNPLKRALAPKLFLWTSNEQEGTHRNSKIYADYLLAKLESDLSEKDKRTVLRKFARTLALRRSILPWRTFAVVDSLEDAVAQLADVVVKPLRVTSNSGAAPKLGFVFTGQGAQWFAMGRELCAYPAFQESLQAASVYLVSIGSSWSLMAELHRNQELSRISSPDLSQPICTALQIALVDLLRTWGIRPTAVVGHSSGEIAAAYAKGAISRESAWKISYHRGYLCSCIRGFAPTLHGSMLATGLGLDDVQPYIERLSQGNATVACVNSPHSTTISGDEVAIDELQTIIKEDGHFARTLRVGVAYHSPHMRVIADKYAEALGDIHINSDKAESAKMFSSLTGKEVTSNSELNTAYWVANLVSPVEFSAALQCLVMFTDGSSKRRTNKAFIDHLIEIGPAAGLKGPIKQILSHETVVSQTADVSYQSILERGENACKTALTAAGRLFQYGYPIHVDAILNERDVPSQDGFLVDIPPYGWNHGLKYWSEPHAGRAHRFRRDGRKDLFGGETFDGIPDEPRYRNILRLSEVPWIKHHKVQGACLYPAAGMVIMAIEAMSQKADSTRKIKAYDLRDIIINKAIVVPVEDRGIEAMLTIKPFRHGSQALTSSWQEFQLYSRRETWELNCAGLIRLEYESSSGDNTFANEDTLLAEQHARQYDKIRQECIRPQNPRDFYNHLESIGLFYGGVFQSLIEIRKGDRQSTCQLKIPDTKRIMPRQFEFPHVIHPATLDNIIQMVLPAASAIDEELTVPMVPVSIGRLYISADIPSEPGTILKGYASAHVTGFEEGECLAVVSDDTWQKPLVIFERIKGKRLSADTSDALSAKDLSLRKIGTFFHWKEDLHLTDRKQLQELCSKQTAGEFHVIDRKIYIELEMACLIICQRVLKECSKEESDKFAWNFKLFYDYMQHCIVLYKEGKGCYQNETLGIDWLGMTIEAEEELLARVAEASTDGNALVQHGKYLPQILRGEISPLEVLMAGDFLNNFYKFGLGTKAQYTQMSWYIDMMAHKNPNMKILEIGAGTASSTLPILEKLGGANGTAPRFSSYTFTDISVGYFEKAKTKLAPWLTFIDFAKLNIEEDPADQGFEEGSYDLIVASNVLHATHSISKTLENTRKMLKPTGKLVMTEVTALGKLRFHMIVGSLEGWWYGDNDGRKYGPTLEVSQWNKALLDAGYSGVEVDFPDVPFPDTGVSVIVSGASITEEIPMPKETLIVLPPNADPDITASADKLSKELVKSGSTVHVMPLADTMALEELKNKSCLCLVDASSNQGFLPDINQENWDSLKRLILSTKDITYVTRGGTQDSNNPSANLMTGMARSIRSENMGLNLTTLDVEHGALLSKDESVAAIITVFSVGSNSGDSETPDWEYAIRNGNPMVQRVLLENDINDVALTLHTAPKPELTSFQQPGRPLKLGVGTPGRLDTLRFEDDDDSAKPLAADEVEISVKAMGLNFKDVMVAMGQLAQPALGVECSGIISCVGSNVTHLSPGDAVMTWKLGTFKTLARAPAAMVQLVPQGMDLTTAASIPVVYSTAHHCIANVAKLRKGESILIHGAAGGVGQGAIILAQHIGATVFATVSTEAKKQLLLETYGIPEAHVFNSRDCVQFSQAVLRLTDGRGVDVVLNSLAGESLRASWRVIARFGRFVELGQRDIVGNTGLDMEPFLRNVSFHSVNMLDLLHWDIDTAARGFAEVVELLNNKIAKVVTPINVIPLSRLEDAFRMMQTGKHMGKIVLEAHNDDIVPMLPASAPPVRFREDATYILPGGGGGLGRYIATWMVKRGARNVLLLSRSGAAKASVVDLVTNLTKLGARAEAWACDIGDDKALLEAFDRCQRESWPAIRGVIQGAMNLQDAIYENMTLDQFKGAIVPKVHGSWNLHAHLPQDLDFFILLSSSVGIAGSRGQGNYSAGNSYQDALAHYRHRLGLSACSLDLGMILGIGFLAEDTTDNRVHDNVQSWNFLAIRERELLCILEAAVRGQSLPGVPMPPQLIVGLGTGGMMAQGLEKYPWWFRDAKFSHLVRVDTHRVSQDIGDETETPLSVVLAGVTNLEQATDTIVDRLVHKLAKSLMMPAEDIEASKPVSSYGVDSLLAVELRAWIHAEIKADVSVFDLLSNSSISLLAAKMAATSPIVPETVLAEAAQN